MPKNPNETTFKRLNVGDKFASVSNATDCPKGNFKKANTRHAFAILEKGNCDVANRVEFSRSCAVILTQKAK